MAVVEGTGVAGDQGRRDASHHRERLRREILDSLHKRIGEEDIVAAGPEKRVRVPIRSTRRYRFVHDRGAGGGVGQGDYGEGTVLGPAGSESPATAGTNPGEEVYEVELDLEEVEELLFASLGLPRLKPKRELQATGEDAVFDDRGARGPLLDKRATLRENMLRNARRGRLRMGGIDRDDLRYRTYREQPTPRTQAVVLCLMDQSGSMGEREKRVARLFYYWVVRFLRSEYTAVRVVFVGHTSEAYELTEEQFFTRQPSGGTVVSSAYRLALEIQRERFPVADWNVYVLHVSDGDNLDADNGATVDLIREHLAVASLVGYLEIPRTGLASAHYASSRLGVALERADVDGLVVAHAGTEQELWPALKRLFARDGVEEAIAA